MISVGVGDTGEPVGHGRQGRGPIAVVVPADDTQPDGDLVGARAEHLDGLWCRSMGTDSPVVVSKQAWTEQDPAVPALGRSHARREPSA
jgi:hypothetical protein